MIAYLGYFLIGFGATLLGSIIGMGGGLIIKPVLGFLGNDSLETITLLSSCCVLAMAIVSTTRNTINKNSPFTSVGAYIIIGSTIGGFIGSSIFNVLLHNVENTQNIAKIQALLLIVGLLIIIFANQKEIYLGFKPKASSFILAAVVMGVIASFLGISGGPFNVAILVLGFGISIKRAAVFSTLSGFFSQLVSLIVLLIHVSWTVLDPTMLLVMIPGGIIGGYIGPIFSKKLEAPAIAKVYKLTMMGIIVLNIAIIMS